jgi:hypothetical protein
MLLGSMTPGDLSAPLWVTAPSEARCSPRIHLGLLVPRGTEATPPGRHAAPKEVDEG